MKCVISARYDQCDDGQVAQARTQIVDFKSPQFKSLVIGGGGLLDQKGLNIRQDKCRDKLVVRMLPQCPQRESSPSP